LGPRSPVSVVGSGRSASPALALVRRHRSVGFGPHDPTDEGVSGLAGKGAASPRGASRRLACEQPGGVRQQCGADAASTASEDDPGIAGPEAPVLEPAPLPDRPPQGSDALRPAGLEVTRLELLGVPQVDPGGIAARTVRAEGC